MKFKTRKLVIAVLLVLPVVTVPLSAQTPQRSGPPQVSPTPTHADILRGEYGRHRANNDLLFYDLDIRVDPEKKFISGKNTIRFKMLKDDKRIQLDLYDNLKVDKIVQVFEGMAAIGRSQRACRYRLSTNGIRVQCSWIFRRR